MHKVNYPVRDCETNLHLFTYNQVAGWNTCPTGPRDDTDHQRKSLCLRLQTKMNSEKQSKIYSPRKKILFSLTVFVISWCNEILVSTDKAIICKQWRVCCRAMDRILFAYMYVYLSHSCIFVWLTRAVYLRR